MSLIWSRTSVACQQVVALCAEELVAKVATNGPPEHSTSPYGYPLTRLMAQCMAVFDPIEDQAAIDKVLACDESAEFLFLYANGSSEIVTRAEVIEVLERKFVGKYTIIAPYADLAWLTLVDYENQDMQGNVPFRHLDASTGGMPANRGIAALLNIAENNGIGQPSIGSHDL